MTQPTSLETDWDPLSSGLTLDEEIVGATLKRTIKNIIKSYTGWYDPFSELIQNALDAIDKRKEAGESFSPKIWIDINLQENSICVTDNGIGFKERQFGNFLARNVSFKSGKTRGVKGVGATYLAYGFNFLQIGTKSPEFEYIGNLEGGRDWVEDDENVVSRPRVKKTDAPLHEPFNDVDRGSTFCLKLFGSHVRPQDLSWMQARTPDQWEVILRLKTPLGGIYPHSYESPETICILSVTDDNGKRLEKEIGSCCYLFPHTQIPTCADLKELITKQKELANKGKPTAKLPDNYYKLKGLYAYWTYEDLLSDNGLLNPRLTDDEKALLREHEVGLYGFVTYSTDVWDELNDDIVKLRKGERILQPGLQMAANGMPQGQLMSIPLTRNTYYQYTSHAIFHSNLAEPDLGRKGFQPELIQLAKKVTVSMINLFLEWRHHLQTPTGSKRQLDRDKQIHEWIKETEEHEENEPIKINRPDIFLPTNEMSLTAVPIVEQDVISLFNQLLAGGVIRGIKLMSASQYKTYDGLWKIFLKKPFENYYYDKEKNPLGIQEKIKEEFTSSPYVIEYKYSFDALVEEIAKGDKDEKSVHLVVCWEMGDKWTGSYSVTPLLHFSNIHHRDIHGITHIVRNSVTGERVFWVVVLSELINYLNDSESVQDYQKEKYIEFEE